jgi:type IV pilus assembly protein PilM
MSFSFALDRATPPSVAVEIAAHRVSAIAADYKGGRLSVNAHAVEVLPDGALVPSLTGVNVRDRDQVVSAIVRVLERVGGARRVGVIVPDSIAKVSLVRFQQVPAKARDLDQLVRWQVRKSAPFPIEEAQVAFVEGLRAADGQEFVVSLARRAVVEEYEAACAAAGAQAGLVDLSTFNVVNAVLAGTSVPTGDWLLVNVAPDWTSMAILRDRALIFFRSRGADGEGTLADLVHQTAMYYEDRLSGAGFSRVLLSGAFSLGRHQTADVEQFRRSLEDRLGTGIDPVDPRKTAALTDRTGGSSVVLDTLTPLVGLLARDREAA